MQTAILPPATRFAEHLVEATQRRDVERMSAMHHPDIDLQPAVPGGIVIRGRTEVRRYSERLLDEDPLLWVRLGFTEPLADDLVLVHVHLRVSVAPNGHQVDEYTLLWQWKDGMLWRQYAGTEPELRARAAALQV